MSDLFKEALERSRREEIELKDQILESEKRILSLIVDLGNPDKYWGTYTREDNPNRAEKRAESNIRLAEGYIVGAKLEYKELTGKEPPPEPIARHVRYLMDVLDKIHADRLQTTESKQQVSDETFEMMFPNLKRRLD
jgi:hypothetical protein